MSKVDVPTKDEIAAAERQALAAVKAMEFAPGTVWTITRPRGNPYRYLHVKNQPQETPLIAWARHAWQQGRRAEVKASGWLGAAQLMGLSRRAGHMLMAAADDFPLKKQSIRDALLAKCGVEEMAKAPLIDPAVEATLLGGDTG